MCVVEVEILQITWVDILTIIHITTTHDADNAHVGAVDGAYHLEAVILAVVAADGERVGTGDGETQLLGQGARFSECHLVDASRLGAYRLDMVGIC